MVDEGGMEVKMWNVEGREQGERRNMKRKGGIKGKEGIKGKGRDKRERKG